MGRAVLRLGRPIARPIVARLVVARPILARLVAALVAMALGAIGVLAAILAPASTAAPPALAVLAVALLAAALLTLRAGLLPALVAAALLLTAALLAAALLALLVLLLAGVDLLLRGGEHTGVMLGMLLEVLDRDTVARQLRVPRKLVVLVDDLLRGAAYLPLGAGAVEDAIDDVAALRTVVPVLAPRTGLAASHA